MVVGALLLRMADHLYQAPSTRLSFLPFDGMVILLDVVDQVARR
jgi:hypothetical protein